MSGAPAQPPRLIRRLLLAAADPDTRWQVISDLDDEFALIQAQQGRWRAVQWYLLQTMVSLPWLLAAHRTGARRRARPTPWPRTSGFAVFGQDIRYALRRCRRQPLVTASVLLSTALGIGATVAVFSVVEALLIRPLPFPEPDQLIRIVGHDSRFPAAQGGVSVPDGQDLAERSRTLQGIALYNHTPSGTLLQSGEPRAVRFAEIGPRFAEVLGVRPAVGRTFAEEEHVFGANAVALLTDRGWREHFGSDRAILGKSITVDGRALTIVGILPPMELEFPREGAVFWTPLAPPRSGPGSWRSHRGSDWLRAIARVGPGQTPAQVQAELDDLGRSLAREHPEFNRTRSYRAMPLQESIVGPVGPTLRLLAGAVLAVLLVACGNMGTLLLAQAASRRREFAVRAALGGGGRPVLRQVLTETMLVTTTGGLLGLLLAPLLVAGFLSLNPQPLPRAAEIGLQGPVLAVALLLIAGAGLAAGIPAARVARRPVLQDALRSGTHGTASSREGRSRTILVVGQVAFSVVVLSAAGMLIRSFWNLTRVELGFEDRNVLTFQLTPGQGGLPASQLYPRLLERLHALPTVREVGMSFDLPTAGRSFNTVLLREGMGDIPGSAPLATSQMVSPRLFAALEIPLEEGRFFDAGDDAGAPPVVIVNRAFAARMFPDRRAVGRRVTVWELPRTIVGVVGDARTGVSTWDPPAPEIYFPLEQVQQEWRYLVIRTSGDPAALVPVIESVVRNLDPTLLPGELATLTERIGRSMAPQRFRGALLGALGGVALMLSIVGIHGVTAYAVGRRTREIGIRLALGERQHIVQRRIVTGAVVPALIGTALGITTTLLTAGALRGFVLGISPRDPATLAGTTVLFLGVAFLAAFGPARRAGRVDPSAALREDG
jgi:predicted permease